MLEGGLIKSMYVFKVYSIPRTIENIIQMIHSSIDL